MNEGEVPEPVRVIVYDGSMRSEYHIWRMTGELVSFTDMVWFDKRALVWSPFGLGDEFSLYEEGQVVVRRRDPFDGELNNE